MSVCVLAWGENGDHEYQTGPQNCGALYSFDGLGGVSWGYLIIFLSSVTFVGRVKVES